MSIHSHMLGMTAICSWLTVQCFGYMALKEKFHNNMNIGKQEQFKTI
jgi:hypothetical protein